MVVGDAIPVVLGAPRRPGHNRVSGGGPDALAPNYILQIQRGPVIHYPLCDCPARHGRRLFEVSYL